VRALLLAAVLASGPLSEEELAERAQAARVGATVLFVVTVAGLGYGARVLARRARDAEEQERLADAFREIDEELAKRKESS
jgi:predicted nucleic acid-binding protein